MSAEVARGAVRRKRGLREILAYLCALADIWGDASAVVEAPPDDLINAFTTFLLPGSRGGQRLIKSSVRFRQNDGQNQRISYSRSCQRRQIESIKVWKKLKPDACFVIRCRTSSA